MYTKDYSITLKSMFPDHKNGDWECGYNYDEENGNNWVIRFWNRPEPQPTEDEFAAAEPAALAAMSRKELYNHLGEKSVNQIDAWPHPVTQEPLNLGQDRNETESVIFKASVYANRAVRLGLDGVVSVRGQNHTIDQDMLDRCAAFENEQLRISALQIEIAAQITSEAITEQSEIDDYVSGTYGTWRV